MEGAILTLAPISLLTGVAMLWVFQRCSNQAGIRRAKNRLGAHLMELRLFVDEPALVWRAQRDLIAANVRYIGLMLQPALILTIPLGLLLVAMEPYYGRMPLFLNQPAIVTVQMNQPVGEGPVPALQPPDGIVVETPPVRVVGERQVSWRIRPVREMSGTLRFLTPEGVLEKSVKTGGSNGYLPERRASSWTGWLTEPGEAPLANSRVKWIELRYPRTEVRWLGMEFHWLVWFLAISMIAALLLKRRMRVTF